MKMNKSKLAKCLWPGLFFAVACLLVLAPAKNVQANCDNGACAVCGDNVQCVDEELCSPGVEICEKVNDVIVGSCPDTCDPNLSLDTCLESPESRISTCRFNDADAEGEDRCGCAVCGNGNRVEEMEQCDDGNDVSGDGCSGCEQGTVDGVPCFGGCRTEECGDGVVQAGLGEECDDGNDIDNDECSNECKRQFCGDGVLNRDEECDGSAPPSDENKCDEGFQCAMPACECELCPACGNGIEEADQGEECDDGSHCADGTDCLNEETHVETPCEDGSACVPRSGDGCEANCTDGACGNGVVDTQDCVGDQVAGQGCEEECDAASANSNSGLCKEDCTLAFCGDGEGLNPFEVCDDGNNIDGDGCSADCQVCPELVCGDGIITTASEGCDPNSPAENDGCNSDEECNPNTCQCVPVCNNDDIQDEGEQCDGDDSDNCDPNLGCNDNCTCSDAVCGNGITRADAGEDCDDGSQCGEGGSDCTDCFIDCVKSDDCVDEFGDLHIDSDSCISCREDCCDDATCGPQDGECDENCLEEDDECPGEGNDDPKQGPCDPEDELENGGHKVTICHIPPGNPDNAHTICVDHHAVEKHVEKHGDSIGECVSGCPEAGLTVGEGNGDETGTFSASGGGCSLIFGNADQK